MSCPGTEPAVYAEISMNFEGAYRSKYLIGSLILDKCNEKSIRHCEIFLSVQYGDMNYSLSHYSSLVFMQLNRYKMFSKSMCRIVARKSATLFATNISNKNEMWRFRINLSELDLFNFFSHCPPAWPRISHASPSTRTRLARKNSRHLFRQCFLSRLQQR